MTSTSDPAHIVAEADVRASLDNSRSSDEKAVDEKKNITAAVDEDIEVVAVYQDGDEIRESDYTEEQYKKLLRKIDRYLLPLMWFCYGIQQTDKTSLSTQAIFGLREDTGLVGQQYSWLTTIFYIAYLCGEFPSNFLLQRWALGRSLSIYMLCWGVCVISIAAAQNWSQLMAIRALQGFFECTISPGFVLVVGSWYRREEHSSRALFWQSANAGFGIIANLVMYGIGSHAEKYGGLAPWRCISLFLGGTTIVLSLICFGLLGSPKEVRWMTKEEKRMAAARILKNKAGRDVTGVKWSWPQVGEAFRDPQLWFSMINAFLSSVPNGALTTFGGIMYKSFGFEELQVLLIEIPRSVASLVIFVIVGIYTRKVANRRMYIMAAATIPPFIGMLAMALLPNTYENRWVKWGMYFMTVPFVLSLFLAWTLIPSNVAGRTKKTIISSATFLGYCVGNMCGSQIFKAKDAPRYIPGTIGASIALGAEFVLICAWRIYYVWQNAKRDRLARESGVSAEEQETVGREMGERDVTDLGNPHFRYTT
ncbi:MFS transporter [Lasiodiplodia theobromae]|uniref:Putative transporter n=1 Tax=Lasiodiplodia theobromae TaxID=45133 RepID=A0A5N5DNS3_9PEZI|nr:MFS transporter [Lasiodiplodia theobromae]KAB2578542.1 putative transporter [Lasiodiplodia theobromae]KAF4538476.1 MFS transporter [Lasiodiplodia theobromae]